MADGKVTILGKNTLLGMAAAAGMTNNLALANEFYFPPEIVGGVAPRVKGQERDIAWHAAAEACDNERLSLIYQVYKDKVWFLAARNGDLAQSPHSWCPFGSLLPGMPDAKINPVCYTYHSDEVAMMMTVTSDMMQIHRGTASVIRAKAERVSRENNNAAIIELVPDTIAQLTPQPWQPISLLEDKLRRFLTFVIVLTGAVVALSALLIWLLAGATMLAAEGDLKAAQDRSIQKTEEMYRQLLSMRTSPIKQELTRFAEINDRLVNVGGWLRFYGYENGKKPVWRATVPPTMTGDQIKELGARTLETTDMGTLVGTDQPEKK
ncbi:MAG: hypothetical protein EBQ89_06125 [Alphaproteobacteria bacterium]|nr:hypothetical protein [Alphaproteobacteria bacterium]